MNRIRGFLSKVSKGFAFFRKTLTNRAVRENAILLLTAPLFPKLHIRLRVKYGHYIPENPIDLSHPKLFNEKLHFIKPSQKVCINPIILIPFGRVVKCFICKYFF